MPSFADLQNLALWRLRARGAVFGGTPNNASTDQNPPYLVQQLLNTGYNEFLSRTLESGIATLKVSFLTVANAISYPLRPLPPTPTATPNPAALRVWEGTYTTAPGGQNGGYEYRFDLVSTRRFAAITGAYTRRLSWFGPRVIYGSQEFGKPILDVAPGTATAGDTIALTIVPDPLNAPAGLTCAQGGPMQLPTDQPLFPSQFHPALVEYVVMHAGDASNKTTQIDRAEKQWEKKIAEAQEFGANYGSGDSESGVQDVYVGTPLGT
jgi:hypothetical protein